jgi:Mn-dependent DtxR family transcriptional regulator
MPDHDATVAEQEYLESLFWLFEAGFPMTGANLARAMRLSAPTVHEMLGRLERDGYIARSAGRAIEFTDSGREHAERVVGRHRMIERFLTDVVGVPWDDVHEEAEKLEHAMTPRFEAYVRDAVGDAQTCPHGHPIKVGQRVDGVPLADCAVGAAVRIMRLENGHRLRWRQRRARAQRGVDHDHPQRRRDRLGAGRPLAPAADCPARATGARRRPLWPLADEISQRPDLLRPRAQVRRPPRRPR